MALWNWAPAFPSSYILWKAVNIIHNKPDHVMAKLLQIRITTKSELLFHRRLASTALRSISEEEKWQSRDQLWILFSYQTRMMAFIWIATKLQLEVELLISSWCWIAAAGTDNSKLVEEVFSGKVSQLIQEVELHHNKRSVFCSLWNLMSNNSVLIFANNKVDYVFT